MNIVFSNLSGVSGLYETCIMLDELYENIFLFFCICFVHILKQVPISLSCLGEFCNTVLM